MSSEDYNNEVSQTESTQSAQSVEETNKEQSKLQLPDTAIAIIWSNWDLVRIFKFIEEKTNATKEDIGLMRILRKWNKHRKQSTETDKTLILMKRSIYTTLVQLGYTDDQTAYPADRKDFRIQEYELREHNYPRKGYTHNLFIQLETGISVFNASIQLKAKLQTLERFDILSQSDTSITIPLLSREEGTHRGHAFVTFNKNTNNLLDRAALAKLLLHDTRLVLDDDSKVLMKCFWAKSKETRNRKNKKNKRNNKKTQK